MFPSHPLLLPGHLALGSFGNFSSTEPGGLECDGCSGSGHGMGARGWVVGLGRPVGCSGALGV